MYHYTESGLHNVWLANGYKVRTVGGEDAVAIHDVDQLHRAIGRSLAHKPYLTGTELRFLRKEMGLSQNRLAELLGSTEQTISLWERGRRLPKAYDRLIRVIYLEKLDGNVRIREMIDRLIDLDEKDPGKIIFEDTNTGWREAA